jgi:hypothetical protein
MPNSSQRAKGVMTSLHFSGEPKGHQSKVKLKLLLGICVLVAVFSLGSTLAANITLNNSGAVEFGQGVAQAVACDSDGITLTPSSNYWNAGSIYRISSLVLSGVNFQTCASKTLTIKMFTNDSTYNYLTVGHNIASPLAFNAFSAADIANPHLENSAIAIEISDDGQSAYAFVSKYSGPYLDYYGADNLFSLENGNLTLTFGNTLDGTDNYYGINAAAIARFTVESAATPPNGLSTEDWEAIPSSQTYSVGDTGPGGGKIFYRSVAGFSCGRTLNSRCHYLEAAPTTGTAAWDDAGAYPHWSGNTDTFIGTTGTAIGTGYKNTLAMVGQSNTAGMAGTISRAYRGPNHLSDWFLPSKDELYELYLQRSHVAASSGYWSSSESDATHAWDQGFFSGSQGTGEKTNNTSVRPIRAF